MALINRTFDQINTDSINRLLTLGYTDAQYKGTAVRDILESMNVQIGTFYTITTTNLATQYLSQAQADALDGLGQLVGCVRRAGEQDQTYRVRIANTVQTTQGANQLALVQNLLTLSEVSNVIVVPYTQGIGSITFYLVGTNGIVDDATIIAAQSIISQFAAVGSYNIIDTPSPLLVNISGNLGISTGSSRSSLDSEAQSAAVSYINTLSMGSTFVLSELESAILVSNSNITDVNILTISTTDSNGNTVEQLVANYTPQFDQQLQPGIISLT